MNNQIDKLSIIALLDEEKRLMKEQERVKQEITKAMFTLWERDVALQEIADIFKTSRTKALQRIKDYEKDFGVECTRGAKVTKSQEAEMFNLYQEGATYQEIADKFPFAPATIRCHIRKHAKFLEVKAERDKRGAAAMYEMRKGGATYQEIADKFEVSRPTVCSYVKMYAQFLGVEVPKALTAYSKDIDEMFAMRKSGATYQEIAEKFGVSTETARYHIRIHAQFLGVEVPKAATMCSKDMDEMIAMRKSGVTYQKIADKFEVSAETARRHIKKYIESLEREAV